MFFSYCSKTVLIKIKIYITDYEDGQEFSAESKS